MPGVGSSVAAAGCLWPPRWCCGRSPTARASSPPCSSFPGCTRVRSRARSDQAFVGDVVFSISATLVFVSLTSIAQVIGPNVLGNLLTGGTIIRARSKRIVLFLDLVGSTGIAEAIGNVRFHALLFRDLDTPLPDGDRLRWRGAPLCWRCADATWPLGTPEANACSIQCLFAFRDALEAARSDLLRRHGHLPKFRAGLHSGPLVAGEIGGFKREIALLGDANEHGSAARGSLSCHRS